jgi:DNA-directed RNA polymerase beta' subunit
VKWGGEICDRCEVACCSSLAREIRVGHVALRVKVVHPWHIATVATLLRRTEREVATADPLEIERALGPIFEAIRSYRFSSESGERYKLMSTLSSEGHDVSSLVLSVVPVVPPAWRKIRDHDAVTRAYAEVLEGPDVRGAVGDLFETIAQNRVT